MTKFRKKVLCKIRKVYQNKKLKEGSSMVSVVIGVTFLAAVGLIALTAATHYVTAVYVDRNSTDNFYETEAILEEVKTGLAQYASESADAAYQYLLDHYLEKSTANKKDQFAKMFIKLMGMKLQGISISVYDESTAIKDEEGFGKLFEKEKDPSDPSEKTKQEKFFEDFDADYLGETKAVSFDSSSNVSTNPDAIQKLSTVPTAVKAKEIGTEKKYKYIIKKDAARGYYITLKNLLIDYTNDAGYRSTIETDIIITVPDYKFQGDSTLGEIKDYISISDDTLTISSSTNDTNMTGNIYAGTSLSDSSKEQGIKVAKGGHVKFNSQKIISRGSMDIMPGSAVDLAGESGAADLWLKNIRLTYDNAGDSSSMADPTAFTMYANAYIANDLDITTDNCDVTLKGKYYGYSYNKENNNTIDIKDHSAEYSSAILINGKNTTLTAENELQKLILAGRTFVSRDKASGGSLPGISPQPGAADIVMGESLAVKSNQLAYLVPDQYIDINADQASAADRETANTLGHNPVLIKTGIKATIKKEDLMADPDLKGLLADPPYTENYSSTSVGNCVYFYLNFKDINSANKYFKKYYNNTEGKDEEENSLTNRDMLEERADVYISDKDGNGLKISPSLFLIAGNIVNSYNDNGALLEENYFENDGTPTEALLKDGQKFGYNYVSLQKSLTTGEGASSMRLDSAENSDPLKRLVSGRILDVAEIDNRGGDRIPVSAGAEIQIIPSSSGEQPVLIDKGLVIAGNVNVKVERDFTGLILSAGKVTVGAGNNLKSDMLLIGQIMEYIESDPNLAKLFQGLDGAKTSNPTEAARCISYDNWKKNEVQN